MRIATLVLFLFTTQFSEAQERTVGLLKNREGAYDGYTLFSPAGNRSVYLIDNCGGLVHEWVSANRPGNAVYLMEEASAMKEQRIAQSCECQQHGVITTRLVKHVTRQRGTDNPERQEQRHLGTVHLRNDGGIEVLAVQVRVHRQESATAKAGQHDRQDRGYRRG